MARAAAEAAGGSAEVAAVEAAALAEAKATRAVPERQTAHEQTLRGNTTRQRSRTFHANKVVVTSACVRLVRSVQQPVKRPRAPVAQCSEAVGTGAAVTREQHAPAAPCLPRLGTCVLTPAPAAPRGAARRFPSSAAALMPNSSTTQSSGATRSARWLRAGAIAAGERRCQRSAGPDLVTAVPPTRQSSVAAVATRLICAASGDVGGRSVIVPDGRMQRFQAARASPPSAHTASGCVFCTP